MNRARARTLEDPAVGGEHRPREALLPYDGAVPNPVRPDTSAVRRPAAGLLRRSGEARRRRAVPARTSPGGRGIPRERLEEVGEHYFLFGGRSPINDQNRAFLDALRADLAATGIDLPVYWGNRNWDPYLRDALEQMAADGVTRAACFVTSAYSS